MHKSESPKIAILGARGYSGLELGRLLLAHPKARLSACFAGDSAFALGDYLPEAEAKRIPVLPLSSFSGALGDFDVVFLATPAEVSAEWAPKILGAGKDVIDLSGAFRLKETESYPKWYGFEHPAPELTAQSIFGLSPWQKARPSKPALIANPGCYATSVLMAILPLLKAGVIQPETLVIDAKSGTSGGGRKAVENLLFTEVDGECLPYKVGAHQHLPEIREAAAYLSGAEIDPFFTTSLLPVRRGIISGIHVRLAKGASQEDVQAAYEAVYRHYPLVQYGPLAKLGPAARAAAVTLRRVVGTPRSHIHFETVDDKLYIFSLIDNLLKGAASQAVENLNWLYDLPVDTGLACKEGIL